MSAIEDRRRYSIKSEYEDGILASQTLIKLIEKEKITYKGSYSNEAFEFRYLPQVHEIVPWKGCIIVEDKNYEITLDPDVWDESLKIQITANNIDHLKELTKLLDEVEEPQYKPESRVKTFSGEPIKISELSWDDIGGLEQVKKELMQYVEWPLKNPKLFETMGLENPKGVLLYGHPGTGKTMLAKVVASQSRAYFIYTTPADITSMWYGQEEKRIRELFKTASEHTPCIIHMDDIDGFFPKGRGASSHEATHRALVQFINEIDGLKEIKGVTVLASTNVNPEDLDPALMREGRFDKKIYVPLPDEEGRYSIYKIHTRRMPLDDVDLKELAKITDGFSGAKIKAHCESAGLKAIESYCEENNLSIEKIKEEEMKKIKIEQRDFESALEELVLKA